MLTSWAYPIYSPIGILAKWNNRNIDECKQFCQPTSWYNFGSIGRKIQRLRRGIGCLLTMSNNISAPYYLYLVNNVGERPLWPMAKPPTNEKKERLTIKFGDVRFEKRQAAELREGREGKTSNSLQSFRMNANVTSKFLSPAAQIYSCYKKKVKNRDSFCPCSISSKRNRFLKTDWY